MDAGDAELNDILDAWEMREGREGSSENAPAAQGAKPAFVPASAAAPSAASAAAAPLSPLPPGAAMPAFVSASAYAAASAASGAAAAHVLAPLPLQVAADWHSCRACNYDVCRHCYAFLGSSVPHPAWHLSPNSDAALAARQCDECGRASGTLGSPATAPRTLYRPCIRASEVSSLLDLGGFEDANASFFHLLSRNRPWSEVIAQLQRRGTHAPPGALLAEAGLTAPVIARAAAAAAAATDAAGLRAAMTGAVADAAPALAAAAGADCALTAQLHAALEQAVHSLAAPAGSGGGGGGGGGGDGAGEALLAAAGVGAAQLARAVAAAPDAASALALAKVESAPHLIAYAGGDAGLGAQLTAALQRELVMQRGTQCEEGILDSLEQANGVQVSERNESVYSMTVGGCLLVGKVDGLMSGSGGSGGSSGSSSSSSSSSSGGSGETAPYLVEAKCRSYALHRNWRSAPFRDIVQTTLYMALLRAHSVPVAHALVRERFACGSERSTRVEWDAALWGKLQAGLQGVAARFNAIRPGEVEALASMAWMPRGAARGRGGRQ